jgi:hypothetical protein
MNKFYQKLWELNEKLEEVAVAFSNTDIGGEEVDHEFARILGDLELTYSKIIELVRRKRCLPEVPVAIINNEDINWVLGIPGFKEPVEAQRLKKQGKAARDCITIL